VGGCQTKANRVGHWLWHGAAGLLHDGLVAAAGAFGSGTVCGMHGVLIRGGSFRFLCRLLAPPKICKTKARALLWWIVPTIGKKMTTTEITIKGMTCGHCAASVTKELEAITGVTSVQVDQPGGKAQVESTNVTHEQMAEAVEEAGYEALEFATSNG